MDLLCTLLSSEHLADIVLVVMVVEALALSWYLRPTIGTSRTKIILLALLPGCFLVLALRAALVHAAWFWIALALVGALISHLADMRQRLQISAPPSINR